MKNNIYIYIYIKNLYCVKCQKVTYNSTNTEYKDEIDGMKRRKDFTFTVLIVVQ